MIDIKQLWEAMPLDVQRKTSCHDLKRIVDNLNAAMDHGQVEMLDTKTDPWGLEDLEVKQVKNPPDYTFALECAWGGGQQPRHVIKGPDFETIIQQVASILTREAIEDEAREWQFEAIELKKEKDRVQRCWDSDTDIFAGTLQLLKEAGIKHGSREIIAASERFYAENPKSQNRVRELSFGELEETVQTMRDLLIRCLDIPMRDSKAATRLKLAMSDAICASLKPYACPGVEIVDLGHNDECIRVANNTPKS